MTLRFCAYSSQDPSSSQKALKQFARQSPVCSFYGRTVRERADDVENIKKCCEIAENIDWGCEVHRNYHDKNMGCDPFTFLSHKWAFSIVDKCIVLEDDIVPSESFFMFCKELLDKRIERICDTVVPGQFDVSDDCFFDAFDNF